MLEMSLNDYNQLDEYPADTLHDSNFNVTFRVLKEASSHAFSGIAAIIERGSQTYKITSRIGHLIAYTASYYGLNIAQNGGNTEAAITQTTHDIAFDCALAALTGSATAPVSLMICASEIYRDFDVRAQYSAGLTHDFARLDQPIGHYTDDPTEYERLSDATDSAQEKISAAAMAHGVAYLSDQLATGIATSLNIAGEALTPIPGYITEAAKTHHELTSEVALQRWNTLKIIVSKANQAFHNTKNQIAEYFSANSTSPSAGRFPSFETSLRVLKWREYQLNLALTRNKASTEEVTQMRSSLNSDDLIALAKNIDVNEITQQIVKLVKAGAHQRKDQQHLNQLQQGLSASMASADIDEHIFQQAQSDARDQVIMKKTLSQYLNFVNDFILSPEKQQALTRTHDLLKAKITKLSTEIANYADDVAAKAKLSQQAYQEVKKLEAGISADMQLVAACSALLSELPIPGASIFKCAGLIINGAAELCRTKERTTEQRTVRQYNDAHAALQAAKKQQAYTSSTHQNMLNVQEMLHADVRKLYLQNQIKPAVALPILQSTTGAMLETHRKEISMLEQTYVQLIDKHAETGDGQANRSKRIKIPIGKPASPGTDLLAQYHAAKNFTGSFHDYCSQSQAANHASTSKMQQIGLELRTCTEACTALKKQLDDDIRTAPVRQFLYHNRQQVFAARNQRLSDAELSFSDLLIQGMGDYHDVRSERRTLNLGAWGALDGFLGELDTLFTNNKLGGIPRLLRIMPQGAALYEQGRELHFNYKLLVKIEQSIQQTPVITAQTLEIDEETFKQIFSADSYQVNTRADLLKIITDPRIMLRGGVMLVNLVSSAISVINIIQGRPDAQLQALSEVQKMLRSQMQMHYQHHQEMMHCLQAIARRQEDQYHNLRLALYKSLRGIKVLQAGHDETRQRRYADEARNYARTVNNATAPLRALIHVDTLSRKQFQKRLAAILLLLENPVPADAILASNDYDYGQLAFSASHYAAGHTLQTALSEAYRIYNGDIFIQVLYDLQAVLAHIQRKPALSKEDINMINDPMIAKLYAIAKAFKENLIQLRTDHAQMRELLTHYLAAQNQLVQTTATAPSAHMPSLQDVQLLGVKKYQVHEIFSTPFYMLPWAGGKGFFQETDSAAIRDDFAPFIHPRRQHELRALRQYWVAEGSEGDDHFPWVMIQKDLAECVADSSAFTLIASAGVALASAPVAATLAVTSLIGNAASHLASSTSSLNEVRLTKKRLCRPIIAGNLTSIIEPPQPDNKKKIGNHCYLYYCSDQGHFDIAAEVTKATKETSPYLVTITRSDNHDRASEVYAYGQRTALNHNSRLPANPLQADTLDDYINNASALLKHYFTLFDESSSPAPAAPFQKAFGCKPVTITRLEPFTLTKMNTLPLILPHSYLDKLETHPQIATMISAHKIGTGQLKRAYCFEKESYLDQKKGKHVTVYHLRLYYTLQTTGDLPLATAKITLTTFDEITVEAYRGFARREVYWDDLLLNFMCKTTETPLGVVNKKTCHRYGYLFISETPFKGLFNYFNKNPGKCFIYDSQKIGDSVAESDISMDDISCTLYDATGKCLLLKDLVQTILTHHATSLDESTNPLRAPGEKFVTLLAAYRMLSGHDGLTIVNALRTFLNEQSAGFIIDWTKAERILGSTVTNDYQAVFKDKLAFLTLDEFRVAWPFLAFMHALDLLKLNLPDEAAFQVMHEQLCKDNIPQCDLFQIEGLCKQLVDIKVWADHMQQNYRATFPLSARVWRNTIANPVGTPSAVSDNMHHEFKPALIHGSPSAFS